MSYRIDPTPSKLSCRQVTTQIKACGNCWTAKPLREFNLSRASRDGHQNYCRACSSSAAAIRRARRKEELAGVGVAVEAKQCRACKTHRSAEHYARVAGSRDGLDDICRTCRPLLEREKGVGPLERCCQLTSEEVRALTLVRCVAAQAKRQRRRVELDWTDYLDRLEAGVCEVTGRRFDAKRRGRTADTLQIVLIDARGHYTPGNVRLVLGGAIAEE